VNADVAHGKTAFICAMIAASASPKYCYDGVAGRGVIPRQLPFPYVVRVPLTRSATRMMRNTTSSPPGVLVESGNSRA
jgi:hypothetical protein